MTVKWRKFEQKAVFIILLSNTKDNDTVKPLSNSPEPEKVNWLPIDQGLPVVYCIITTLVSSTFAAPPAYTDISPAKADVATREPANAVNPIFLILFILITPLILFIINNKH